MRKLFDRLRDRMNAADERYGGFASTHEMLGVAYEEWLEVSDAVRANELDDLAEECLDLASVLLRCASQIEGGGPILLRSGK